MQACQMFLIADTSHGINVYLDHLQGRRDTPDGTAPDLRPLNLSPDWPQGRLNCGIPRNKVVQDRWSCLGEFLEWPRDHFHWT